MESLLFLMFTLFSRDFSEGELHRTEIMIKIKGRWWFSLFVSLRFSKLFHGSFTYFLVCIHVLIGLTSVVFKQRHQFLSDSVYTLFYLFSLKTQQCIQIKKPLQSSLCIINIVIRITIIVILKNKKMLYKVHNWSKKYKTYHTPFYYKQNLLRHYKKNERK